MARRNIFRKAALDRLSSPDQLDALLSVTSPRSWLALLTAVGVLTLGLIWGCLGTITSGVEGQGLVARSGVIEAVLYVPAARAGQLRAGMAAEIVPSTVRTEEFGFIRGHVTDVADSTSTEATLADAARTTEQLRSMLADGPVVEVRVALERDPATASGLRWSSPRGGPVEIADGTPCTGRIVTRRERPIDLVL